MGACHSNVARLLEVVPRMNRVELESVMMAERKRGLIPIFLVKRKPASSMLVRSLTWLMAIWWVMNLLTKFQ